MENLQELISEAIATALAEDGGGMATAWTLTLDYLDAEGADSWTVAVAPNQWVGTSLGQVDWARGWLEYHRLAYYQSATNFE